jgi:DNA-binding transcriptional ArsR family regulator
MQPVGYGQSLPNHLDATFAALADPTRRAILARLASGEASVTELAEPFAMSQPAISKHLKVLERAGLISRGFDAQRRPRRLEARPLAEANEWLENYRQFWEGQFQRLDALLHEMKSYVPKRRQKGRETKRPKGGRERVTSGLLKRRGAQGGALRG